MTSRRDFIKTGTAGAALLCLGCRSQLPNPTGETPAQNLEEIRRLVLRYALFAPSSHNTQPWRVELTDSGMRLYVDQTRLLSAIDPLARQSYISQGTFLELLSIAARKFGHSAQMRYFPDDLPTFLEGQIVSEGKEDKPVAAVTLQPDAVPMPDPLFEQILRRITNKRRYNLQPEISAEQVNRLRAAPQSDNIGWCIVTDDLQKREVADLCKQAMSIEVSSAERNRETATWFRFSDRELREKRDGFGLAQTGTEGIKKWIVENFVLSRERAGNPNGSFAQGAIAQTEEQANSASIFAALVSKTNSRLDQVLIGRAYARVHLTASQLGMDLQPLSQGLEEYDQMLPLQRRMKRVLGVANAETVQMLFRLGHAMPTPRSPRREVTELIHPSSAGFHTT